MHGVIVTHCWLPQLAIHSGSSPLLLSPVPTHNSCSYLGPRDSSTIFNFFIFKSLIHLKAVISESLGPSLFPDGYPVAHIACIKRAIVSSQIGENALKKKYIYIYIFFCMGVWHPTPVLLPGKSHGWRSLVGCSPWGR